MTEKPSVTLIFYSLQGNIDMAGLLSACLPFLTVELRNQQKVEAARVCHFSSLDYTQQTNSMVVCFTSDVLQSFDALTVPWNFSLLTCTVQYQNKDICVY